MRPAYLLPLAFLLPYAAAQDGVVFRSDVSLVRVDTQVVDRQNRTITGLHAEDFVLRVDGEPQQIRNFASEEMPADVLLLLDVSGSMRPHVERVAAASTTALRVLGDDDRLAIMVFDRATRVRLPFRSSREDVEREFERLLRQERFNGGTDITRALLDAAEYMRREGRRDARRAIVILTDDQTEFKRDVNGVLRAMAEADAVVSALLAPNAMGRLSRRPAPTPPMGTSWPDIILGPRGPNSRRRAPGPVIVGASTSSGGTAEIAESTGGDSMRVDEASAFEWTLARLRQRYALHYHLPQGAQAGWERPVEVELAYAARQRYPDAEVRYRRVRATGEAAEPTMVSRNPAPAPGSDPAPAPANRRRRGVDEPMRGSGPAASTTGEGGWRRVEEPAKEPGEPAAETAEEQPRPWRRLKPGEEP
jgi:VWFA-related protein